MVTATKTENLMASTWTRAALVRRAFNAGPRRKSDREFGDLEDALLAAYVSFRDIRREMKKAELSERDTRAAFVLMTAAFEGPPFNAGVAVMLTIPDTIKGLPDLLRDAEKYANKGKMIPLGVVFWQRDRDERAKEGKSVWIQSWRVDPRLQRAANAVREEFRELDGRVDDGGLAVTFEEL
jgi:hypothetical protein